MAGVDNRIVGLQFDNARFESGVKQSIKSLEELNKGLEFKDAGKGFSEVQKAADSLNLSKIATAVDQISDRFSTLGIIGMRVLTNLADSAMDFGRRMGDFMVTGPAQQGYNEYEKLMTITKVLINTFPGQMDVIKATLKDMNTFADETIYAFSDMTDNITKFTNAGMGVAESGEALKGVAAWAALSGATTEQASRAMFNVGQAFQFGKMTQRDFMSVSNANMASMEFKLLAIGKAVEMGVIEPGEYTTETWGKFMEDGKFNAKVLGEVLSDYGNPLTEIGARALRAAKEVNTLTQVVGIVKETLGTGWAEVWEQIFGGYDEAKNLFTGLATFFTDSIRESHKARMEAIGKWREEGGRNNLLLGLSSSLVAFRNVLGTVKEAFANVFGNATYNILTALSTGFANFGVNLVKWLGDPLADGSTRLEKFGNILEVIFKAFRVLGDVVGFAWQAIKLFLGSINIPKIASGFLDWLISTGNAIAKFGEDAIATYGPKIVAWFGSLGEAIAPVFGWIASVGNTVISFFSTLWNSFAGSEKVQGAWADIKKFFTDIPLKITEFIASFEGKSLGDILKGWVVSFIAGIPAAIQKIKDAIAGFWETLFPKRSGMYDGMPDGARAMASANPMMMMSDGFTKDTSFLGIIKSTIDGWKKTISEWFSSLWTDITSNESIISAGDSIKTWFTSLFRGDEVTNYTKSATGEMVKTIGYMPGKIEMALMALWGQIQNIPAILVDLGVKLIAGLPGVLQSIGGFFSEIWKSFNIKEKFKGLTDGLGKWIRENVPQPILDAFAAIGNFIAPAVESVKAFFGKIWAAIQDIFNPKTGIEKIDSMSYLDKLKGVFANPDGVKLYFTEAWEDIKSKFADAKAWFTKKMGSLGDGIKSMFSSVKKFLTPKKGETTNLFDGLGDVLASLGGGLSKLWDWMMDFSNQFTLAGAATFGTVIFVILAIAKFFNDIGSAAKNMAKAALRTKVNFWNTTAGQLVAIVGAVALMAGVMYTIGNLDLGKLAIGFGVVAAILTGLGAFMYVLTKLKVNATIGISLLAMAGSVILVIMAVKSIVSILKGIDGTNWLSYVIALVAVGGILGYMAWLLKKMGNTSFTGTVDWKSIIAMAAALWIILQTLKPIANYNLNQLVNMGLVLAGLTIALTHLMKTSQPVQGFKAPNWKPVLAAAAGIWLVGISLRQFSKMTGKELLKAGLALAAITVALGWLMDLSTNKRGGLLVGTGPDWNAMLAAAAGIWLVAQALLPFANMTPEQLGRMALALVGITAALAALVAIQTLKTSIAGTVAMGVAALGAIGIIWMLGEALSKVKDVNTETIETFIDGLAVIFAAMIGQQIIGALNNAGWAGALTAAISNGGAIFIIQSLAEGLLKVKDVDTDKIYAFTQGVSKILWAVAGLSGVAILATVAGVPLGAAITAIGVIITGLAALDQIPGFAEFIGGAGDILGSIAGAFEGAYSVEKFKRISTSIVSIAAVDLDKTKTDAILTFMQDLSDFMTGAGGKSKDIDDGQSAADKAISTLTGEKLLKALTSLGESLPPITKALGPTFNSRKFGADTKAIITFMGSLATFMSDLTDQNVEIERYTSGFEQFIGAESGPFQMVMQGLTDIGTRIGTFASSIKGIGSADFVNELGNAIAAISSVKNFMIEVQGLGDINNANFNQVTDGLDTLGYDIEQFVKNVGTTDVKRFTEFAAGIKDLFSGLAIISDISAGVAGSGATLTQAVTDVVNALAITIDPAAIKMSLEAIGNHITRTIGDGMLNEAAVSSMVDKMNALLANFGDGGSYDRATSDAIFIELAKWFIAKFAEGITESSGVVEDAVSSMTDVVGKLSRSTSVWNSMFNTGAWYARGLAMGLRSEMDDVIDAANALGNAIASSTDTSLLVNSPSKKGVKTGQYYGDGLVIGMTNRVKEIRKAATGIGSTALEAVNTKLGIHSPSWEAMKQGAQYVKGFAVGLQKNTKGKTSILSQGLNWLGKQVVKGSEVVIKRSSEILGKEKKTGKIISVQDMLRDNIAKIKADRLRADAGEVMNGALSALGVDVDELAKNPLYGDLVDLFNQFTGNGLLDNPNGSGAGANAPGGSGSGSGGRGGGGGGGGGGGSSAGRVADVVANDMSRKDMMLNLEQQFDKIAQKLDGLKIVLDDGTLVGRIMPEIDQQLGLSIQMSPRI